MYIRSFLITKLLIISHPSLLLFYISIQQIVRIVAPLTLCLRLLCLSFFLVGLEVLGALVGPRVGSSFFLSFFFFVGLKVIRNFSKLTSLPFLFGRLFEPIHKNLAHRRNSTCYHSPIG